ncbi:hypothetical protein BJX63DRAFT_153177 [Aspergillus granulosus]|uniref:Uncharacterized protein n=1 Tax=Aspergillus granulosus TaxID=176169 RepID=A0ABR4HKB8_9EURO
MTEAGFSSQKNGTTRNIIQYQRFGMMASSLRPRKGPKGRVGSPTGQRVGSKGLVTNLIGSSGRSFLDLVWSSAPLAPLQLFRMEEHVESNGPPIAPFSGAIGGHALLVLVLVLVLVLRGRGGMGAYGSRWMGTV